MRERFRWLAAGAATGVLAGLLVGWCLGSAATCGESCGFDVALFEAIGTWVGGVGIATVGGAYLLYRTQRERVEKLRAAEMEALALARDCAVRFKPLGDPLNGFRKVNIQFDNKLGERVHNVCLRLQDGTELRKDNQVAPDRSWGTSIELTQMGINAKYPTAKAASEAINRAGKFEIAFEFTVRGFDFERVGGEVVVVRRPPNATWRDGPLIAP